MTVEIVGDAGLAEGEHPLQRAPRDRRAEPADRAERELEINGVDQPRRITVALNRVDMHPARKRSLHQLIGERPARLEVDVACAHAFAEWFERHLQNDLRARLIDAAGRLDYADVLPRRQEALDGALAGMPRERRLGAVAHGVVATVDHGRKCT